jgi:hypothetical protein
VRWFGAKTKAELEFLRLDLKGLRTLVQDLETNQTELQGWPELNHEQQIAVAARWDDEVCNTCGGIHQGICRRVKRCEMDEFGRPRILIFWREGEWTPDPRTIWPEDVWPDPAQMAEQLDRVRRDALNRDDLIGRAAREAQRQEAMSARRPSPRQQVRQMIAETTGDNQ